MKTIEESIEIEVPVSTAYNQWTQFERSRSSWTGRAGRAEGRHAAALGCRSRRRESASGTPRSQSSIPTTGSRGRQSTKTGRTASSPSTSWMTRARKVMVQMNYEPEGMKESVGSAVGLDSRRVKGDLESFKEFIETRGSETGAWRGEVES